MKKLLLFASLVIASVNASVSVTWDMPDFADELYRANGVDLIPSNSVWQLIWSPDNAVSSFNATNPFLPDASESLLSEHRNSNPGYITGLAFTEPSDTYVGGYVYTRVFDYQGSTSSFNLNDLDGMWYINSTPIDGPLQKIDNIPPGAPTDHVPFTGFNQVDSQFLIPEPGTLAMLGAGVAVVVFGVRRRRYRG